MTRVAVVLLEGELRGPEAAATLGAASALAGEHVRTLVLTTAAPLGELPAVGTLEVGILGVPQAGEATSWFQGVMTLLGDALPDLVLFAAGELCDEVAARVAGSLGYSPVLDVEALDVVDDAVVLDRSAFGGKATHRLRVQPTSLVLGLVGGGADLRPPQRSPDLVRELELSAGPLVEVEYSALPPAGLAGARLVIAGGRGVGGEAGFLQLQELANRLGGAVGASRAAVDAGWASADRQVGLTGMKVRPEVYMAIGISGASQHLAGMSGSGVVLAVNSDASAPMADAADVAFIADWHALWPHLRDRLDAPSPPTAG